MCMLAWQQKDDNKKRGRKNEQKSCRKMTYRGENWTTVGARPDRPARRPFILGTYVRVK